jgi:hypothetical protein
VKYDLSLRVGLCATSDSMLKGGNSLAVISDVLLICKVKRFSSYKFLVLGSVCFVIRF